MISVVIPAYNEQKTISNCLDSLVKQTTSRKFEVIVCDNNSTDKTKEYAKKYSKKLNLKVITEKRKGRAAARETGFRLSKGDIIFSTDADAIVPNNWIEIMEAHFNDENVIAVSGVVKIIDLSQTKNTIFNSVNPFLMRVYRLCYGHVWLSGYNFAIRKDAYKRAGGFNTELNVMEDIDLGFKVAPIGKIKFARNVAVVYSSRRFEKGLFAGFNDYLRPFLKYRYTKRKDIYLSDIR